MATFCVRFSHCVCLNCQRLLLSLDGNNGNRNRNSNNKTIWMTVADSLAATRGNAQSLAELSTVSQSVGLVDSSSGCASTCNWTSIWDYLALAVLLLALCAFRLCSVGLEHVTLPADNWYLTTFDVLTLTAAGGPTSDSAQIPLLSRCTCMYVSVCVCVGYLRNWTAASQTPCKREKSYMMIFLYL